jgi:hypothetical protein
MNLEIQNTKQERNRRNVHLQLSFARRDRGNHRYLIIIVTGRSSNRVSPKYITLLGSNALVLLSDTYELHSISAIEILQGSTLSQNLQQHLILPTVSTEEPLSFGFFLFFSNSNRSKKKLHFIIKPRLCL